MYIRYMYVCVCIYIYIYRYICVYICVYIYIYIWVAGFCIITKCCITITDAIIFPLAMVHARA